MKSPEKRLAVSAVHTFPSASVALCEWPFHLPSICQIKVGDMLGLSVGAVGELVGEKVGAEVGVPVVGAVGDVESVSL